MELFFIVSGFIMCMRAAQSQSGVNFILGRIRRIVPNVLAVHQRHPHGLVAAAELGDSEHEMIFYSLVACVLGAMRLRPGSKVVFGWALAGIGAVGGILGPQDGSSILSFHVLSPYMFAFSLAWLFRCWEERQGSARFWIVLPYAFAFGIALWFSKSWGLHLLARLAVAGLVFCLFVTGRSMLSAEGRLGPAAWELGDASYIYLAHWFVLSATGKLPGVFDAAADAPLVLRLLGIVAAITVRLLWFRWTNARLTEGSAISRPPGGAGA